MMPAATHFDPVIGVDVHIVQPPGPVPPVPIPHPYVGIVFDPADYIPIIGSTIKINGMNRAIAGTAGKALPKHIPIGGAFVPPIPADEHENFMGSATVEMDGDAAAYMALPCLSCQSIGMPPIPRLNPKKKTKIKSLVLPTTVVLPIPKGMPVLIGGPPTISLMSVAMHLVGPLAKALGKTKAARRAAAAFRKAKQRVFRNMKPGFLKCNVLKAEPVDVVTGEVVVDQLDFELPGRIPIRWTRHYRSGSTRRGICGVGWETPADARLEPWSEGGVVFHDGTGVATYFDVFPETEPVMEPVDGGRLHRMDRHYAVELKGGLTYYFDIPPKPVLEIPVAAIIDRCRNSLHFLRDVDGLREVVESAGRRLLCHSENGLLRSITLDHPDFPEQRVLVRFEYDVAENLTAVYDALNHPYTFGSDDRHRLIRHTNRTGLSFYYEYDGESRCVHSWGDGGLYDYRFTYDPAGRSTNLTDSLGHPWTVEYDEQLLINREIDPLGGVTSYAYDETGRTTAVVDPAGRVTRYGYDGRGNLTSLIRPDGTALAAAYHECGLPLLERDASGAEWRRLYNEQGRLLERQTPRGGKWLYEVVANGDIVAFTDPEGCRRSLTRDRYGLVRSIRDADGNSHHVVLDILGRIARGTDHESRETIYQRDAKGQIVTITYPSQNLEKYYYDEEGRLIVAVDRARRRTEFLYTGLGELAAHISPDGRSIRYFFDTEERLCAVQDDRGRVYRYERDQMGRVTAETDYWAHSRRFEYDTGGRIVACTDALGTTTRFDYDVLDRMLARKLFDGTEERFAYDVNSRMVLARNSTIEIRREYDSEGNLIREHQGDFVIEYSYDLRGLQTERCSNLGHKLEVRYDAPGRPRSMLVNGTPLCSYDYDGRHFLRSEKLGQHCRRRFDYDADGRRIASELHRDRGHDFAVRSTFDEVGNLISREVHGGELPWTFRASYDPADRMVGATVNVDASLAGHRPTLTDDEAVTSRVRAAPVRRETNHKSDLLFDARGDLVRLVRSDRDLVLTWNGMGRLSRAHDECVDIGFAYDALGRRVSKVVNGREQRFVWDGDRLMGEVCSDLSGAREFVFRSQSHVPLAAISSSGISYFLTDEIGLSHAVMNEAGTLVYEASFDAQGRQTGSLGSTDLNPFRFAGQYFDHEIGLSYNRYRYFDHESNRYISADPLRLAVGVDLYSYGPNVWRWRDPLGLSCEFDDLSEAVLYRIKKGDKKGRPFGSPRNPRPPTVAEFNPRIEEIPAGELEARITSRQHGIFPEQADSIKQLSNEELTRFRLDDPISAHPTAEGLELTGGHHRTNEIINRVNAGDMPPDALVPVLLHD